MKRNNCVVIYAYTAIENASVCGGVRGGNVKERKTEADCNKFRSTLI